MRTTDQCRGWRDKCGAPVRYWMKWSYDGAREYPTEVRLCVWCAILAEEFVIALERERMTDCELAWGPIIE